MARIDFKTDIPKHFVRKYGWLPACQNQLIACRKKRYLNNYPLRYFTFCAAEAIDVFMLEREGILKRSDETGRLQGVYFCEQDAKDFGIIADLIGSPEQGFRGELEKIVLFEDDNDTKGKSLEDIEPYPPEIRKKLNFKDAHNRLRRAFPFDIINLDVYGVMFPPRRQEVITPLLKSLIRILEWQTEAEIKKGQRLQQFTLFLTSHITPEKTNPRATEELTNIVSDNLETYIEFRSTFNQRYKHTDVIKLRDENFAEFFCVALPKFVIEKALMDFGWEVVHETTYLYNRPPETRDYQIMHSIAIFKRLSSKSKDKLDRLIPKHYAHAVAELIKKGMIWVDDIIKEPGVSQDLQKELAAIVDFRDQIKKGGLLL